METLAPWYNDLDNETVIKMRLVQSLEISHDSRIFSKIISIFAYRFLACLETNSYYTSEMCVIQDSDRVCTCAYRTATVIRMARAGNNDVRKLLP